MVKILILDAFLAVEAGFGVGSWGLLLVFGALSWLFQHETWNCELRTNM